jgi:CheY-like chemotaxis protein
MIMKTCVLFPKAFNYNYMDGSAAHSLDFPSSFEQYLNPSDLDNASLMRRRARRGMSLLYSAKPQKEHKVIDKKMKLLHVEDSAQIRLLVSIFLKNEFDVESVETGERALKQVQSESYDIILMDINLGRGIDGFETSKKIREFDQYSNTPIIALTTNNYDDVRKDCISSRINAYIQKPFEKSYLLGTIQEINKHLAEKSL